MGNVTKLTQKQPINIDLSKIKDEVCGTKHKDQPFKHSALVDDCDSTEFTKVFKYKKLSALVSPIGKEQVIEISFIKCLKCGAVKVFK